MKTTRPIARPIAAYTAPALSWSDGELSATTFAPERRAR